MTHTSSAVPAVLCGLALAAAASPALAQTHIVGHDQTWTLARTTTLTKLVVDQGGNIAAPDGYAVTMTVDGVEQGQRLATTAGVNTVFVPGTYQGDVVLTVTRANPVTLQAGPSQITFPFRQSLYLNGSGVVRNESVPSSWLGGKPLSSSIRNFLVVSTGQDFDGLYVAGGSYRFLSPTFSLDGDGRSDFVGYGAAVVANAPDVQLVLDHARIFTHGVVRTAIVANGGANVVVKNSTIATHQGVLPKDYQQTVDQTQMRSVPWMLGLNGQDNLRATNLLGPATKASYINSDVASDGWGVLSTDSGMNCTLTVIDSDIHILNGGDGYGSYAIGNATEYFAGASFSNLTYGTINTGGALYYEDSTPSNVASLNASLGLGLTQAELANVKQRPTTVSARNGVMWHSSSGTVNIAGGTQFSTSEAVFLDKSAQPVTISVDGSQGASLASANGVLMQVMDDDDPGPQGPHLLNDGVYVDPYFSGGAPARDPNFDTTATANAASASFSNTTLTGNFYNSSGWTYVPGFFGGGGEQNMVVSLNNAVLTGLVSSTEAHHYVRRIDRTSYYQLGEVRNTPAAAINNGAIVQLANGSTWHLTGTAYLTAFTVDATSGVVGADGSAVGMTVNGTVTPIVPGNTYTGQIVLTE